MKCSYCGKEVSSVSGTNYGDICDLCEYLLTGKKMNLSADFDYTTHDGIVLWIKDGAVTSAWHRCGQIAVETEHMKQYVPLLAPTGVIEMLRHMDKRNEVFCSNCGKVIHISKIAGSHFAGIWCDGCWEDYKKANGEKCLKCGSPRYKCCC